MKQMSQLCYHFVNISIHFIMFHGLMNFSTFVFVTMVYFTEVYTVSFSFFFPPSF